MKARGAAILLVMVTLWAGRAQADHLFTPEAGFAKARQGQTLWVVNMVEGVDVAEVIRPWNDLAGWRLFGDWRATPQDAGSMEIWVMQADSTWVLPIPEAEGNYRFCIIWAATSSVRVLQHELGHCLGFADHVRPGEYGQPGYTSPRVCGDPSHPAYSAYRGIESYCDWFDDQARFGPQDQGMLERTGYARKEAP